MPGLTVYLNRDGLNTVETDQTAVRATRSINIVFENHGKPTHVHLHLDDDLATLGTIEEPHWFVPKGEWREADLKLMDSAEGSGRLEITAGYGQEQSTVDIEVEPSEESNSSGESAADKIGTVGGTGARNQEAEEPRASDPLTDFVDFDRLRNPVVLGAGGAFLFVLVLLLFVNPASAVAAGVAALLVGLAVWSYLTDWDPWEWTTEES